MKRKHLLAIVQQVEGFEQPKVNLEQYMTPADIAIDILSHFEVNGKVIVDLGCGTGMLSIAALLLEAKHVYSIDIDKDAIDKFNINLSEIFEENVNIDIINSKIEDVNDIKGDICISNPPFGTRQQGIDKLFIQKGLKLCPVMYSLHKSSTRDHLIKYCASLGAKCKVLSQIRYNIDNSYTFHKSKSKDIEVDLLKITIDQ